MIKLRRRGCGAADIDRVCARGYLGWSDRAGNRSQRRGVVNFKVGIVTRCSALFTLESCRNRRTTGRFECDTVIGVRAADAVLEVEPIFYDIRYVNNDVLACSCNALHRCAAAGSGADRSQHESLRALVRRCAVAVG